ncbi:hypothetical protein P7228_05740 [Altererythrobacter arenosus]|uniref:Uncharacterized protein n=1 Tax=Altererythrobacter arenosus TaxID=3032592 RepID=A0ABY8FU82_9SPHN|nr:hypothetical protein [Altererythrobacter sp. CAU 1644]WFL78566.1 hypothetical protein P7228_05740 [Altererythrobacter sp. CAU 1644]
MSEEVKQGRPVCGQCGKPAVMMIDEIPLCIDCEYKFQQSRWMVFAQNAAMYNMADRQMVAVTGMPHLSSQIDIPNAPVPPIHYNNQNVTVQGGTVGAINFGNVNDIQVNLQALTQHGEIGVADALANMTNAILETHELAEAQKNELLEQLAFLSSQATAQPQERKPGMIKSVLGAIGEGAGAIKSIADAWGAVAPLLQGHFGIG